LFRLCHFLIIGLYADADEKPSKKAKPETKSSAPGDYFVNLKDRGTFLQDIVKAFAGVI
jgi:hypothetical protein